MFALVRTVSSGTAFTWHYEAGDRRFGGSQLEVWEPHPDSREKAGVPKGTVRQMPPWESTIFKGTKRDWWMYVPAQYRPEAPAAVMVFQDGNGPRAWVPVVFDNLIARGDMPVTVGVFIEPGGRNAPRDNRSFEYDTLSDQYARFLLEEILPEVEKTVKLRHDAASRAIAGQSSGGICAFTVAWERPNEFSKVISWTGSFTNIAAGDDRHSGGHNYEALVRRTPKKPIRVILQPAPTISTTSTATGSRPTRRWRNRWSSPATAPTGDLASTATHTAGRFSDSLRWLWRGAGRPIT
jgi:enterochelin esterase family protein